MRPGLDLEQELLATGLTHICGVDEAGRGPLCGPVVAAAVILPPFRALPPSLSDIDDSKRLTATQRERLAAVIRAEALALGLGISDAQEIDRLNIRRATLLAMSRAVTALRPPSEGTCEDGKGVMPGFVLVDGRDLPPGLPCTARAVVKGDQQSASIAAAAILAKTHRDGLMAALAETYPGYGWERNAGYPTQEHLAALERLGVTPAHRRSYGPVARLLALC
ncbi:MAG: ribonuclease HII [Magnetococcales bacterium]|nr:ribonuclease HII [Magnetococcales bacterium]